MLPKRIDNWSLTMENLPHDVTIEQAWIGEGSLRLPICRGEEISDLAPVRGGKAMRASMAYVVDDQGVKESGRSFYGRPARLLSRIVLVFHSVSSGCQTARYNPSRCLLT